MNVLHIDGFDANPPHASGKASYLSPHATRVAGRRPSSYALRIPQGPEGGYVRHLDDTYSRLVIGAAIRVLNLQGEVVCLGVCDTSGERHHYLVATPSGIVLCRQTTEDYGYRQVLAKSGNAVQIHGWNYIEFEVNQGTHSLGSLTVRVNGVFAGALPAHNVRLGGGPLRTIYVGALPGWACTGTIEVDDLYVTDSMMLGDVRVDAPAEAAAVKHTTAVHSSSPTEVLRRDTAAAWMTIGSLEVLGEEPWPGAPRGVFAFRHDWSEPLVERLQWATRVVRVESGNESRAALRNVPRRYIAYHVGHGRATDALVADWLADHMGRITLWPLPQYTSRLLAAASAGALTLQVTAADSSGYIATGEYATLDAGSHTIAWPTGHRLALLMASDSWQVVQVATVSTHTVELSLPLERPAPTGAIIVPLVDGIVTEPAEFAHDAPGLLSGSVTAQVWSGPIPTTSTGDPTLLGLPVWPDDFADDHTVTPRGRVAQQDLSPADPWTRRLDPWPMTTFRRRYWVQGRGEIARWRARLYAAMGRYHDCWIADRLTPALSVVASTQSYCLVREDVSAFWSRPAGAMILLPNGSRLYALISACHYDGSTGGTALVFGSPTNASVPEGSRVVRLVRARLDHDTVAIHWHHTELAEIPVTMRQLQGPVGFRTNPYLPGGL